MKTVRPSLPNSQVVFTENYEALCEEVVQRMLKHVQARVKERGFFTLSLAGGTTPKGVYTLMSSGQYRNEFPWEKIHFFWGDERWVAPEDTQSNYHTVVETLLTRVDIPLENIHPIRTRGLKPEKAAENYEEELRAFFHTKPNEAPHFDLILLGLGQDGHTASLFPGSPALHEKSRLTTAVTHPGTGQTRISMTLAVINSADHIFFLVSGREKAEVLYRTLNDQGKNPDLPAQRVKPQRGMLSWFADNGASSLIRPQT